MNRYLLAAPLVFFALSGIALFVYFLNTTAAGSFHDNMLPQLIGFCLEGFFLVGLLAFVQQLREHDRRRELRLSLRGSLRSLLSHLDIAFLKPDAEPTASKDLEQNPRVVERLLREIKEVELEVDSMVALKRIGIAGLSLAHDLIPVAAQLSAGHMRWWIAIVDNMKKLSEAGDRHELEQAVYNILLNLNEFDSLRY